MARKHLSVSLYPRNKTRKLDVDLFRNPTSEYRGTPFWSWNNRLDVPQLLRQIEQFKQMGFGGFHIHSRTGLETEYLGDEFMAAVLACTDKAKQESMLSWLYDEDRWPSGFAGGLVTRDKRYRVKQLLWTATPYRGVVEPACQESNLQGARAENGVLLARYEVVLKHSRLARYRRLKDSDTPSKKADLWYAYLETVQESSWFNHQTYVDTFSRSAIERFIETTHERYKSAVGKYFGTVVPAIFTDEPQFPKKSTFNRSDEKRDLIMPFTTDFVQTYRAAFKQDLLDHLPELFWDLEDGKASVPRYRYHDHTAERFARGFGDTLGRWCEKNGIALTGHMLAEPTLGSQTRGVGEAMRGLRSFQLPGIDILCDRIEYTTAKQAQSVAHQYGRSGVLSELYGVTNWDFDFVGHKAQGDWQAALGVTVRVPHLAWVSMAGESKRDYPAAIGYQSPWYTEYPLIENHFSRVNTVMTRGQPLVRVGVIHPLESFWLCCGPLETNQPEMQAREDAFRDITTWLIHGLIDFDYISEGLLDGQGARGKGRGKAIDVGDMKYDAVVVPGLRTIRSTTLKRLKRFARSGGTVIFAGEVPELVDAKPSSAARKLARRCQVVGFDKRQILDAMEPFREIEVRHDDGSPADSIIHQIRLDGKRRHIFLVNTDRASPRGTEIRLPGKWDVTVLDTMSGDSRPMHARIEHGRTIVPHFFEAHGHLLITLKPGSKTRVDQIPEVNWVEVGRLSDPVPITLSEPNVLLLDQATWRLNDEPWEPLEEILRIDNLARQRLSLPMRQGRIAQPWTDTDPAPVVARLQLRFTIRSDVRVDAARLALEDAESVGIMLDGQEVPTKLATEVASPPTDLRVSWWVDEAIKTVQLPSLSAGEHELLLTIPFTRKANVEWCYLLGDFGVAVSGRWAKLVEPVRTLAFGDWTTQGLPFYAGNVTYHCSIDGDGREILIEAPKFKNPLLTVELDAARLGPIAFAPFQISLGRLIGKHALDITAHGNRVNAFGAVHNANEKLTWYGPAAWRHTGASWSYEYQLRRMGILTSPIIRARQ